MSESEKIEAINNGYDRGLSLIAIVRSVGTDDETLRIVRDRIGVAMSTLRRVAAEINETEEN